MASVVLIHGAWHGAWCWDRLRPELEMLGHQVSAVDLPVDDPDADFDAYAGVVADAAARSEGPVVLVAHSLAGVVLPLAAARVIGAGQGVALQVHVCAILHPARVADAPPTHHESTFRPLLRYGDGSHRWPTAEAAAAVLYNECSATDAAWAFPQLRLQHTARPWASVPEPDPWPRTPERAIVCTQDRTVLPGFGLWAARQVLGTEPVVMDTDHSPFLGRPAELAAILDRMIAEVGPEAEDGQPAAAAWSTS